jgi:hypothetical protein
MTSALNDGYGGYLVLFAIVVLAHEPWRWFGFLLGRNLRIDSQMFLWVRCVATALVSGLVMKLLFFPAGTLATVPLWQRLAGLTGGTLLYVLAGRRLAVGVVGGSALLLALEAFRAAGWVFPT